MERRNRPILPKKGSAMSRRANLYDRGFDSKPTSPPDCGTMSEREIDERESEIQDRVDTKMLHLKRMLRQSQYFDALVDTAENETPDFDDAARTLFMHYALDLELDYLPASVKLAAVEYLKQVRAVLTKAEEKKP